jgi:gamma-glutamyltranspeptidase/glutathione hydrolase
VWLAEALRVAHGRRLDDPIENLLTYEEEVRRRIGAERARELRSEMDVPGHGGETTHFSLVDGQGMAVAVTQSLNNYYGAKVAHPELGILYNDYMQELEVGRPDHPFALGPDALPYSSMSATILSREGRPVLAVGSPGSKRIISAVVQVVSHWVDVKRGIRAAVEAPRLHVVPEDDLFMEARGVPASHLLELEKRGYSIVRPLSSLHKGDLNPFVGGVHAVAWEGREWEGAADPRRDGAVGHARARQAARPRAIPP